MDEQDILSQIHDLVRAEHDLRDGGHEVGTNEAERLRKIEYALPVSTGEGYLQ